MIEIDKEYNIDDLTIGLSVDEKYDFIKSLILEAQKQKIRFIRLTDNDLLKSVSYWHTEIFSFRPNQNEIFKIHGNGYKSYKVNDIRSICFLDAKAEFKTDWITDYSKICAIMRAVIFFNNPIQVLYQSENNRIVLHEVYAPIDETKNNNPFNDINFVEKFFKEDSNRGISLLTYKILAIRVYNKDGRLSRIQRISKNYNISEEEAIKRIYTDKQIALYNNIYKENVPVKEPKIKSEELFYTHVKTRMNEYLLEDDIKEFKFAPLYLFLLDSCQELGKYTLSDKSKMKLLILFIDRLFAIKSKFTNFDTSNYWGKEITKTIDSKIYNIYRSIGEDYVLYSKYNINKCQELIKKCKNKGVDERIFASALIKIYSTIPIKKFRPVKSVLSEMIQIFEEYSIHIEITQDIIGEYYEVVFNERKTELVLIKKKY